MCEDNGACTVLHPFTKSCAVGFPMMFRNILLDHALGFYFKLYVPFLLLSLPGCRDRGDALFGFMRRTVRSAATLSAYCAVVLSACCAGVRMPGGYQKVILPVLGSLGGSAAFLMETDSRQSQLVQFMFGHALDVFGRGYQKSGFYVPKGIEHVLFALAITILIDKYQVEPGLADTRFLSYFIDGERRHVISPSHSFF